MSDRAKIKEVVDYHPGAVVSKTLLEKDTGSITVFAFDQGQGLSEHTAPYDALLHILDGEALATISGESHELAEGEYIILPANKPHSLRALSKFKMLLVMIKS
ncbi:MAG: cupin domain-containing protein [Candidatus Verstraetearchaeota archaeon]|nr:cupin domain-containing protein [Candidatus Verstraetearchaeota archaeon]